MANDFMVNMGDGCGLSYWNDFNVEDAVKKITATCGYGKTLIVGSSAERLVKAFLKKGVDAYGYNYTDEFSEQYSGYILNRFIQGSILDMAFSTESFDTIVYTDVTEPILVEEVSRGLAEFYRIAKKFLFLCVAATCHSTGARDFANNKRGWWEKLLFNAGFRKHPSYYKTNEYEALEYEEELIFIPMEKLPYAAYQAYPLDVLSKERDLHMDMLRETGQRSDGHIIRYQLAAQFIRPGDTVLDAACGLGYGAYVMRHNSMGQSFIGVDNSIYAIEYANVNFAASDNNLSFYISDLSAKLSQLPDSYVDFIASFETLEHVTDPEYLLQEFKRILKPGGRIIVSVPNDWSDETGEDPNPYHFHVYTWRRLLDEMRSCFIVESTYQQIASGCKVASVGNIWLEKPRLLRHIETDAGSMPDSEWWIMTAMKDPIEQSTTVGYVETVFYNMVNTKYLAFNYPKYYHNPWLLHSLVNISFRLKSKQALVDIAHRVLATSLPDSADYGAALCVLAYRELEDDSASFEKIDNIIDRCNNYLSINPDNPHVFRWHVSLLFVMGHLYLKCGLFDQALAQFEKCLLLDALKFGVHLSTKTTESYFLAGWLSLTGGNQERAKNFWKEAVRFGEKLLSTPLAETLINDEYPNLFDYGDGMRELTLALEYITRCVNGLHLLHRMDDRYAVDWNVVYNTFFDQRLAINHELIAAQLKLVRIKNEVDQTREELRIRTVELDQTRADLRGRTSELDQARADLRGRTAELDQARADLRERTAELDQARAELRERTAELDQMRASMRK